jgi:hypothetical protein
MSELLVQPADHQHRHIVVSKCVKFRRDREQIRTDFCLARILSATAHDEIDLLGEFVARIVLEQIDAVAMPFETALQHESIAPVAVNIHVTWVELQECDRFVVHRMTSTFVCLASSRRIASIAV